MNNISIQKRDALINYFGSINEYQKFIFDKVPPIFFMFLDEKGDVYGNKKDVVTYLLKESQLNNITIQDVIKRDTKIFENVIEKTYYDIFNNQNQIK